MSNRSVITAQTVDALTADERAADEERLSDDLIDRVAKLSRDEQDRLCILIANGLGEKFKETEEDRQWWREEIARRLASIEDGTAKFYTVEETLARMQAVIDEGDQK